MECSPKYGKLEKFSRSTVITDAVEGKLNFLIDCAVNKKSTDPY